MWSARLSSSQEPDEEKLEKSGEIGGFHPTDDIGGFKKESWRIYWRSSPFSGPLSASGAGERKSQGSGWGSS